MPIRPYRFVLSLVTFVLALTTCSALVSAQDSKVKIDSNTFGAIEARSIGPALMSGRISAIDALENKPSTLYVGAANGGVWKSTNGGTTFKPVFDKNTQSIGCITIDQAHPETVWVGTGEVWVRNSTSVGGGLFKTTDGGDNWTAVGFAKSERIGRIVIDPKNSEIVYVAVLGPLWSSGEERGLYKTTDGGKNWERILYVDANTGCSDIALDPQEPNTVYAGMWQFRRQPWTFTSGGPGSTFQKSTDGGKTWKKLTKGLPEGELGRITIRVAPSRPNLVYAVVEAKESGLYRSDDLGESWTKVSSSFNVIVRPFYFGVLAIDPKDYNRVYKPGLTLSVSKDGGKSFSSPFGGGGNVHSDHHALWIDPTNPAHMYLGTDGGVYESFDYANTFKFMKNLPVSQFYHVAYDMERPYNVYGGLQDNGSWVGPSTSPSGVQNRDWRNVGFGDGFWAFPDPADKNIVFSEYQGGKLLRFHRATGEVKAIQPYPKTGEPKFRFNWNTPFKMSESKTLYVGSQFLLRSTDRGDSWERISEDLTTNDPEKQKQDQSGGLSIDNSSAENHCTIFAICESPLDPKVIWVGTDDGNVQLTQDGGKTWTNLVKNIPSLPANTWVSCIEASRFDPGTAYATFEGHQTGDMKPYVYKTTDFGKTWTSIATDSIKGFAHVVREDLVNKKLLFVGTEFGLFLSVDGGEQWAQFTGRLPNVAVRDIAIHPREGDVILATHGRGLYVIDDITPIRKITQDVLNAPFAFLENRPSVIALPTSSQEFSGNDEFVGDGLTEAASITYYMKDRHQIGEFKVEILDSENKLISTIPASKRRGINRITWQMRMKPPKSASGATLAQGAFIGPAVPEGTYTVKVTKGKDTYTGQIKLVADPRSTHSAEDRKLQQQTVMKLYQMQEKLGYLASAIQDAREQAQDRAKKVKDMTAKDATALTKSLEGFATRLEDIRKTLVTTREGATAGYIGGEEQLRERIVELYANLNSYGGRPTQSQMDSAGVLEKELEKADQEFNKVVSAELEGLNTKLQAKKLDPVKVQTKEEYDKKEKGS